MHCSERLGAGDDLDQFLGDNRLARAVIGERLLLDHLAGVAGGVVHRGHAGALLGGGVLHQRADNATRNAGDMIRKQTLTYNRTRQAMITKELIEIISGAEAL